MAKRKKRTLRERAAHINFRPPKSYVDRVVEASIATGKEPNELGKDGMMLMVDHRFFDFEKRLTEIEENVTGINKMKSELFRIGKLIDEAVGEE